MRLGKSGVMAGVVVEKRRDSENGRESKEERRGSGAQHGNETRRQLHHRFPPTGYQLSPQPGR